MTCDMLKMIQRIITILFTYVKRSKIWYTFVKTMNRRHVDYTIPLLMTNSLALSFFVNSLNIHLMMNTFLLPNSIFNRNDSLFRTRSPPLVVCNGAGLDHFAQSDPPDFDPLYVITILIIFNINYTYII